ncbi:chondroitin AC/alginate lyase [Phaeosphaeria sp. MPI-PUGE-AT-0046c]|nr:chondroitin AC/alginate lyase [Phaeosphaeria sp. MPI-PUGE-AT-0046c]
MQTPSFAQRPRSPRARQIYSVLLTLFSFITVALLFGQLREKSAPDGAASSFATDEAYHVRNSHPRLFATPEMWLKLPELIARDPYLARWNQTIFDKAQVLHDKPTVSMTSLGSSGKLDEAREVQLRIKHWAYVYRLTKQNRWKNRIWQEILAATSNSTLNSGNDEDIWNSGHWLDVGEFLIAFSLAYDWLHEAWTGSERDYIMSSITKFGLEKGASAYDQNEWFLSVTGNWNCVTNAGMIIGSLAIYHEDRTKLSRKLLSKSVKNVYDYCMRAVYSDGTWSETPDYWYFGTQAHAELSSALMTATESLHNTLNATNAWSRTGWFHIYNSGPVGKFDYGDCGPLKITATANSLLFDGNQLQIPAYTLFQRDRNDAADPLSMFWYDFNVEGTWHKDLPLDKAFSDPRGAWFSTRSSWTDPNALFVAMKAGQLSGHQTHGNLDAGDFVLEAMGEKWAVELCHEDYESPGYFSSEKMDSQRWNYYRCGSKGQNNLLFNQSNQLVNASPTVESEIGENDTTSYWIADLTSAYGGVVSMRRGTRLLNGRTTALIQDEIIDAMAGSQWRMHTTAIVTLSEDKKIAELHLNEKRLTVSLQSTNTASFSVEPSVKLRYESMQLDDFADRPNQNTSVLVVDVRPGNATLAMTFQPIWDSAQKPMAIPSVVPLDDWDSSSHEAVAW